MADEFQNSYPERMEEIKKIFSSGDYIAVFDLLQWLLRRSNPPISPVSIRSALEKSGAAYRLLGDNFTIVPISTEEEKESLKIAPSRIFHHQSFPEPKRTWLRLPVHLLLVRRPIA